MRLAFCVAFVLFGLRLAGQTNTVPGDFSITLERTGCLGNCPEYNVTVFSNGWVRYEGRGYVRIAGTRKSRIPSSDVQKLVERLQDEDFFKWEVKDQVCVDFPEVEITATLNGKQKQVLEGCNAPGKVLQLANEIDRITGAKRWVGTRR